MNAQPDAGAVAGGQPGDRLAAPADPETTLSDAEHAIGEVIRYAESLKMRTYRRLDAAEVADALLAICAPWTGMPVRELEAIGTGPLLDPDCKAGKCGSCVGAPCEHECHKKPEAGCG
jgi:hypothetical protein